MRLNVDFSQKDEKNAPTNTPGGFRKRAEHTEFLLKLIDFAGENGFYLQSSEITLDGADIE